VEDPNPVPGMPSLDLRLVRVNKRPEPALIPLEGPIRLTIEGGSEWEPIKFFLEGDEDSNKTNTASNTHLRLTTQNNLPSQTHQHAQQKPARLAAYAAPVRPMAGAG
jgi:hypothetical protein